MAILDHLENLDLTALDAADLYVLAYRLHEAAQRAAVAMLEQVEGSVQRPVSGV